MFWVLFLCGLLFFVVFGLGLGCFYMLFNGDLMVIYWVFLVDEFTWMLT